MCIVSNNNNNNNSGEMIYHSNRKRHCKLTALPTKALSGTTAIHVRRFTIIMISLCQYLLVVQGQIISITPGTAPSASPSASPTRYSIKVPPVPTMEPTEASFAPSIVQSSVTVAPIPIAQVSIPPWILPPAPITTPAPSSAPLQEATNVPSAVPVLSIVNATTNMPSTYAPAGIGPTTSIAPVIASPTPNSTTINLDRDEGSNDSSSNKLIFTILLPIMIVLTLLLCFGIFVSYRPKRMRKKQSDQIVAPNSDGIMYDFDPDKPDGIISVFDDSSIYTSSVNVNYKSNRNDSVMSTHENGVDSVGGVVNQDFTDTTEVSYDDNQDNGDSSRDTYPYPDEDDDDDDDDGIDFSTVENRTTTSNSALSAVTPNSFENRQIGYMEEGMMIQERYDRLNKELYASERSSPQSDASDIIRHAQSLLVSQTKKDANALKNSNPQSPKSDEGVEVTFRKDNSDHTAHYDDIVGVENTSTMSYGTSNDSSPKGSVDGPTGKSSSVHSAKILDILAEDNFASTDQLYDFDDQVRDSRNHTTQPQHNPLSTMALFARGRTKRGPFGKSNSKKVDNNLSQYKTDEPYPMMIPTVVDSMNNDDQNSSCIEPFSELTTDFHYGEHDSVGSSDAHIILESIKERVTTTKAAGTSSSCDSSANNTFVFENDTDSTITPLPFHNKQQRRNSDRDSNEDYNLNLPLDFNGYDDGSANSQFDKLYESMSNEWEWKQPPLTPVPVEIGTNNNDNKNSTKNKKNSLRQQSSIESIDNSADDTVLELGNILLV